MEHTEWHDLDPAVRHAIEQQTGPDRRARTASAGLNSHLALILDTPHGTVFIKGLPAGHPGIVRQHREAMINPHVLPVAPRLRWHAEDAGWDLLAFDYIPGARHADYTPGSPDLLNVVEVMNRLHRIPCPDLPVKDATQRWAAYIDDSSCLAGDTLLHTDVNRLTFLLSPAGTWIIDWAWPTRGAAFIDPACFLLRLIAAGHTPASAERWASHCDGWHGADPGAIDAFATASARLYTEIAHDDPQPWKQCLAMAADQWAAYRNTPIAGSLSTQTAMGQWADLRPACTVAFLRRPSIAGCPRSVAIEGGPAAQGGRTGQRDRCSARQ